MADSKDAKTDGESKEVVKVDPRIEFIEKRTQTAFKHVKADKFKKSFNTEANT